MDFRSFHKEDLENFQKAMLSLDEEDDSSDVSERIHRCLEKSSDEEDNKINLEAASLLKNNEKESKVQFEMQNKNYNDRTIIQRIHNDLNPINIDVLSIPQEIAISPQKLERFQRNCSFSSKVQEDMSERQSQGFKMTYNDNMRLRPQYNDVLSGRIPGAPTHPGNEYYRQLVRLNKVHYITSSSSEKKNIISFIMNRIHTRHPPGRFLKASTKDAKIIYAVMSAAEVKRKIGQALRENAPRLRKELMQRVKTTKTQLEKRNSSSDYLIPSKFIPSHRDPTRNSSLQYDMRKVALLEDTATKHEAQTQSNTTSTNSIEITHNLLNGVSDIHIRDHESNSDEKTASINAVTMSYGKSSFPRHTAAIRLYGNNQKTEPIKNFDENISDA